MTDQASIAAAAAFVEKQFGHLDLLVNNATISNTRKGNLLLQEYAKISQVSNILPEEVRSISETNVFGVLAVYQSMLPLLRKAETARIVKLQPADTKLLPKRLHILQFRLHEVLAPS